MPALALDLARGTKNPMIQRAELVRSSLAAVLLLLAGCGDGGGPTEPPGPIRTPGMVQPIAGDAQEGRPGQPLSDSVVVQVLDQEGVGMGGVTVRFEASAGSVAPASTQTSADGLARTSWTLGSGEGAQTLTVRVEAPGVAPITVTARARVGVEAAIEALGGAGQAMPVGCALPQPLRVRVMDASGAAVADAPVTFAATGGAREVVRTGGDGVAELSWVVAAPGEQRMVASISGAAADTVEFAARAVPIAPNGFATIGNRIVASTCADHRFVGMARPGLQWWPSDARLADADLAAADFATMRSWGANVVRIPVYQRYWMYDVTLEGLLYARETYRDLIAASVARANAAGLAVIIDLHASDRGDPNFPNDVADIQQMADVNHSVPFWRDVARRFRGNGQVLFQLYNEPNQISWDVWRNGGQIPGGDTFPPQSSGIAFEAAGMQALHDAVRAEGADNVVIINGVHWGYDLSRVPEMAIEGHNIVYATHPYDYPDKQSDDWDRAFGNLSRTHPVMIAEFGDYTCNRDGYYTQILDYADRMNLSWVAWAWWAPAADRPDLICGFPALIEDWSGRPSPTGAIVRERLARYRGQS